MVTGSIGLESAMKQGDVVLTSNPGYCPKPITACCMSTKVNLLPDHLVDLLLDVSASGVNYVERDGVSHQHDANFVLLGTMNPDEGELRATTIGPVWPDGERRTTFSPADRMRIVRQRIEFDNDPAAISAPILPKNAHCKTRCVGLLSTWTRLLSLMIWRRNRQALRGGQGRGFAGGHYVVSGCQGPGGPGWKFEVTGEDVDQVAELVLAHRRNTDAGPDNRAGANTNQSPGSGNQGGQPPPGTDPHLQGSSIQGSMGSAGGGNRLSRDNRDGGPEASAQPTPLLYGKPWREHQEPVHGSVAAALLAVGHNPHEANLCPTPG